MTTPSGHFPTETAGLAKARSPELVELADGNRFGLYGTIVVVPSQPDYWPAVNRELTLTLDDILLEDGTVAPFSRSESTYTAMGRFGNVLLVNGEPELSLTARQGEVVRLYLTDTANTRVFNVGLPGAHIKVVGGDSGHYEREEFVEGVLIAPSERVVVDVLFDEPGELTLEHRTPDRTYPLATEVIQDEPGRCPKCGMKLLATQAAPAHRRAPRERHAVQLPRRPIGSRRDLRFPAA